MFFKPSCNLDSSIISSIELNPPTSQVMVQFKNNSKTYIYDNVNEEAIVDVFFNDGDISFGKFVNAYCKGNRVTVKD